MNTQPANDTTKSNAVTVWEIRSKDWTRFGHKHEGKVTKGHHAEIVPGKSIRLFGLVSNCGPARDGQVFRRDYKVGDVAACDSFNMVYTGEITAITAKTVTVVQYKGSRNETTHRMSLCDFDRYNWDFDAEKTAESNAAWSD